MEDAAVGFLLENLKNLIQYNSDLFGGLEENITKLCQELEVFKAFFEQYNEACSKNENLERFVKEMRQVIYKAEDVIETYIVFSARQKVRSTIAKALHVVDHASELRKVRKDLDAISKELQRLHKEREISFAIEALRTQERPKGGESRIQAPILEGDDVVGFDDEVEKVIDLLIARSEQLEVISIIGMIGLGKTTLARKVFRDPRVDYEFFLRVWVHVSQEYKRKEVFLRILGAFTPITEEMVKMSEENIAEKIRDILQVRKYLIIMDDVWTPQQWDDLKNVLPNNKYSSKVLITSRYTAVASHANPRRDPYRLGFLSAEASRELLRRRVFGENRCPLELESFESRIIEKCEGLPLSIVVVAGILLNDRGRPEWWTRVADNDLKQGEVIRFSSNQLPYHLKTCFLYLGVFGEDFEIPVWKLLLQWIAEGFIESHRNVSLEDVAEDYLEELVERNLVMVVRRRLNGKIKTCRVHGILRDICKEEAMKANFYGEIKRFGQDFDNYRRLCINSSVLEYIASQPSGSHVRSFLSFAKEKTILPLEHISSIPKGFKLLRVLDVISIILTRFPFELINLVLLKYIALSCHFKILPEKMSNLRNLQTVIIETSSPTLEVKADIWKMPQLRHLYTNASIYLPKVKGEFLAENLQTLATVSPESCRNEVFERTPLLKKLAIGGNLGAVGVVDGQSSLFDTLVKLEFLENLKLLNEDLICPLPALPPPDVFPRKLKRLTLLNTLLDWKYMSTLGKLENLEVLKLKNDAFKGHFWQTEDGGFRSLRVLLIGRTDLVLWKARASHFPVLTSLFLKDCIKLQAIPPSFGEIESLQNIDLYCTNTSVASSARTIQLLKLEVEAQGWNSRTGALRLSVYPPEQ